MTHWDDTGGVLDDLIKRGRVQSVGGKPVKKPPAQKTTKSKPIIPPQEPIQDFKISVELIGQPITKKNSMRIMRGRLKQSEAYCNYEEDCLNQTLTRRTPLEGKLHVTCLYYMKTAREPDLLNLMAATHDILEKANFYVNDKQIKSVDGSRIMGKDDSNPRVEIMIEQFRD